MIGWDKGIIGLRRNEIMAHTKTLLPPDGFHGSKSELCLDGFGILQPSWHIPPGEIFGVGI